MSTSVSIPKTPSDHFGAERRRTSRITYPFPGLIRWADAEGNESAFNTVLDNLSAGGFYLRLVGEVQEGTEVECSLSLGTAPPTEDSTPSIKLHGVVVRTERQRAGVCGLGVVITSHRFL